MSTKDFQLIERARLWASEINEVLASESQIARRGTLIALLLAGAILMIAGLHSTVLERSGLSEVRSTVASFSLALVVFLAALWVHRIPRVTPRSMLALCIVLSILFLVSLGVNGSVAAPALSAALVLFHILLRPSIALGLCGLLLVGVFAVIWLFAPLTSSEYNLRLMGASVAVTLFMQLVVRHWRRMAQRFTELSEAMGGLASQMQSELEEVRRERESLRVTDVQSGLPNLTGFIEKAQRALLATPVGVPRTLVKLRMDNLRESIALLDGFDEQKLLARIEARIRAQSHAELLIGKVSATELLLVCPQAEAGASNTTGQLIERIREAIEQPMALEQGGTFLPRCHIGLSEWPRHGIHVPTLIKHADTASIEANRIGASQALAFSPQMRESQEARQQQMRTIAQAIRSEQLQLVFQPIAQTAGGRLRKAEALVRVIDPDHGPVSPAQYLEHIQDNELLVLLTDWVLKESARQVAQWRRRFDPSFQLSVNIPPHCLGRYIADWTNARVRLMSIEAPPDALVFEITEDASILSTAQMGQTLQKLRALGFRFALDDFGIGYSNLTRVHDLPLDFIKIDQQFVRGIENEPGARAVVNAIVSLARELGIHTIAEGVETEGQTHYLRQIGCTYLQGYGISRPMSATQFEIWMGEHYPAQGSSGAPHRAPEF